MAAAHYDALESRDPAARERELFTRLPEAIARAMTASGWARQLKGVDPKSISSRAALAKLPLLRKSDLLSLQKDSPPFGGFNVTPPGKAKRLHGLSRGGRPEHCRYCFQFVQIVGLKLYVHSRALADHAIHSERALWSPEKALLEREFLVAA